MLTAAFERLLYWPVWWRPFDSDNAVTTKEA